MQATVDFHDRDFVRALEDAGLWSFPRLVGTPEQEPAANPYAFFKWWEQGGPEGERFDKETGQMAPAPYFIAHNAHVMGGLSYHELRNPREFVFSAGFGDFDANGSPAETWEDVQRVSKWLVLNRVEHYWKYSGSECGFHLRMFFAPEQRPREYLARWESALWRGLKNELSVRSIDIVCAEPKRLERIPYSRYVHKKTKGPSKPDDPSKKSGYVRESNFCVPVPWGLVHEGNLARIRDLSRYPEFFETVRFTGDRPLPTLESFVRRKGWETFGHVAHAVHPMPATVPTGDMAGAMRLYAPSRLCVQMLPFGSNPRHAVRLALLYELMGLGMGYDELFQTITAIGREARWEDYDETTIAYFIRHALERDYHPYGCEKLAENGLCLGATCPRFRREFPAAWREHVEKHPEALL